MAWPKAYRLIDGSSEIPHQISEPESAVPAWQMVRLIWRMDLAPGELRPVYVDPQPVQTNVEKAASLDVATDRISNNLGTEVRLGNPQGITVGGMSLQMPRLDLIPDTTNTWSHNTDHYPEGPSEAAIWSNPALVDSGPIMAALLQRGCIGQSKLLAEWRIFDQELFVELILRINWVEEYKILKLTLPLPSKAVKRWDGIPNGVLERGLDRVERSIHDRVLLEFQHSPKLGIVCPEVYAADADAHRLRLTLLRSPLMAWHAQVSDVSPRAMCSDHGEHVFRFRFLSGADLTSNQLETHAWMMMRPPLVAEWTDGMPW